MLQPQCRQLIANIILKQTINKWQTAVLLASWNFHGILADDSSVSLLTWNEKTCRNSHPSMEINVTMRVTKNTVSWRLARWFISVEIWVVLLFCNFLMWDAYLWFYGDVLRNRCKPWDLFPASFWEADLTLISVSLALHFCITALQRAWKELSIIYCNISRAICAISISYWFLMHGEGLVWPSLCVCSVFDFQVLSSNRLLHLEDTLSWRAVGLGQNRGLWHGCWNKDGDHLKSKWMDFFGGGLQYGRISKPYTQWCEWKVFNNLAINHYVPLYLINGVNF